MTVLGAVPPEPRLSRDEMEMLNRSSKKYVARIQRFGVAGVIPLLCRDVAVVSCSMMRREYYLLEIEKGTDFFCGWLGSLVRARCGQEIICNARYDAREFEADTRRRLMSNNAKRETLLHTKMITILMLLCSRKGARRKLHAARGAGRHVCMLESPVVGLLSVYFIQQRGEISVQQFVLICVQDSWVFEGTRNKLNMYVLPNVHRASLTQHHQWSPREAGEKGM